MENVNNILGKNVENAFIVEGFGHGFISALIAKALGLTPIAFSTKETEEEFSKEVDLIAGNLSFVAPNLRKATWNEREELLASGWNIRQSLINGELPADMWTAVAGEKLIPAAPGLFPAFAEMPANALMFVPQKLVSDGACGATAQQQSLSPDIFSFLKESGFGLVLGQHFHKVNDLEKVEALADEFDLYVPGLTEDNEVFGIRGVRHEMYWNLYSRLNGCIGIAGTHTWYLLTCRPEVPQIILFNNKGIERWKEIESAYQAAGYPIHCLGFDDNTDMQQLSRQIEELYHSLF